MVARASAKAEQLTEVTKTTTGFTDVCALTHTPADNSTWVYLVSADARVASISSDIRIRGIHDTDTTVFANANYESQESASPNDVFSFSGFYVKTYGASPGSQTISIEYAAETAGVTVGVKNARVVGFELSTNDDASAGSTTDNTTTDAVNYTTLTSSTLTLDLSGEAGDTDWIILAVAESSSSSNGVFAVLATHVDGTIQAVQGMGPQDTTNYTSFAWVERLTLSAASHDIDVRLRSNTGGTQVQGRRGKVLALKVDDLEAVYYAEARTRTSGTGTTYASHQDYNPTIDQAVTHLILGSWWKDGNSTSVSSYARFYDGTTVFAEDINEMNLTGNEHARFVADTATLASGSGVTWSVQDRSETTSATTGTAESAICIIQLAADAASAQSLVLDPKVPAFMAAALAR